MSSQKPHVKLFIPGPTEVAPEVFEAMSKPMIGHRQKVYSDLQKQIKEKLKAVLFAPNHMMFLSASSATGLMEGFLRNCTAKRNLSCICGAFSLRWHEIAIGNGKEADALNVEWGQPYDTNAIDKALATGKYDTITTVYNETSTGVKNDLEALSKVIKKYPDVIWGVDAVSGMMGAKIETEKLGIDFLVASVQKCFALPPGLAIAAISNRAMERAKSIPTRGYYFDFIDYAKYDAKDQTPATPAISLLNGLNFQLDRFIKDGLENRFRKYDEMAEYVRNWAEKFFALYPPRHASSQTVTCIKNTRNLNVSDLNKKLAERNLHISNGYGDLKEKTFRIAHMGELTLADIKEVLSVVEEIWQLNKNGNEKCCSACGGH
ncbi:MAG: alanine--glyoxylate aminotransferase family protein [Candidatus Riflebacteria bacterium]|nr:alanine--glyoxylate aminotransferase family protein [Candidatus Riflebacteria bacterium]